MACSGSLICSCASIREDPPTLDREGGNYKYSRAFKEVVEKCLVKDPTQRQDTSRVCLHFFDLAQANSAAAARLALLQERQERKLLG